MSELYKTVNEDLTPQMTDLPRHPVFEIAEQAPVFFVNGKVYSLGEGSAQGGEYFYQEDEILRLKKTSLVELGDFNSLESLASDRVQSDVERIGENYAGRVQKKVDFTVERELDIPQLIYKRVFPYLQEEGYKDKVLSLLELEAEGDLSEDAEKERRVTGELEKIADKVAAKVQDLIKYVENDGVSSKERDKEKSRLDVLLGYKENNSHEVVSPLERALGGQNMAIIDDAVYNLVLGGNGKSRVRVDGKSFSLTERQVGSKPQVQEFGRGASVKIRGDSEYAGQHGGIGVMRNNFGDEDPSDGGWAAVVFEGGYSNSYRQIDLEFAEKPPVDTRDLSLRDLENKFLMELGKKVKVDALKKHFSKDKIIDLLGAQNAELLAIAGKKEYIGDGFGFVQDKGGNYHAYIDFTPMAIKSEKDKNYYFYDKTKLSLRVGKNGKGLSWDNNFYMVKNNGHPYVHSQSEEFAKVCQGAAASEMPTSGKDIGEVIVKRLKKIREVLRYGYTWRIFDPAHEGEEWNKDYKQYRRKLPELEEMGIPIVTKEGLNKW